MAEQAEQLVMTEHHVIEGHKFKPGDVLGKRVEGKIIVTDMRIDAGQIQARLNRGIVVAGNPADFLPKPQPAEDPDPAASDPDKQPDPAKDPPASDPAKKAPDPAKPPTAKGK